MFRESVILPFIAGVEFQAANIAQEIGGALKVIRYPVTGFQMVIEKGSCGKEIGMDRGLLAESAFVFIISEHALRKIGVAAAQSLVFVFDNVRE